MCNLASHSTKLIVVFLCSSSCHSSSLQEVLNSLFDVLLLQMFLSFSHGTQCKTNCTTVKRELFPL